MNRLELDQRELLASAGLTVAGLYDELTDRMTHSVALDELMYAAAERVPGLVPARAELDAERARPLADKHGLELRPGTAAGGVPGAPRARAATCVDVDARTDAAGARAARRAAPAPARSTSAPRGSRGRAAPASSSCCNPRHLNAEDGNTLGPTEAAVDLILLDPEIEVGVFRGGAGRCIRATPASACSASGINLTHLYRGRIDFLFYLVRDLGYVNKLYRGLQRRAVRSCGSPPSSDYAIGGACQLLHVVDHVLATRGSRLYLPARKEGIIPGASNLRLPRFVGDRAARQAILSGREWIGRRTRRRPAVRRGRRAGGDRRRAGGADRGADRLRARQRGRQPARDADRPGAARPVTASTCRLYAREQAYCHLSPALVRNLERQLGCRPAPRLTPRSGIARPRRCARDRARRAPARAAARDRRARAARPAASGPQRLAAAGVDAARATPLARRPRAGPVHDQGGPARPRTRSACSRSRASGSSASTPPAARTASRPSSATRAPTSSSWTELMARCMTMAGVRPGMVIHNANGYGLFTGGLGFHQGGERIGANRRPGVGRVHRAPGDAARATSRADVLVATPSYALAIARRIRRRGRRSAPTLRLAARAVRRRAVGRADARGDRVRARPDGGQLLRPVGDVRAGRGRRVPRGARRAARPGGPLPGRGHRPRPTARPCRPAPRASSCSRR